MSDSLFELNKEFAEKQRETKTCGLDKNGGCHAPKFEEVDTEAGLPIAVCPYHYILLMCPPDMREEKSYDFFDIGFQELKEKTLRYNEKIRAEEVDTGDE